MKRILACVLSLCCIAGLLAGCSSKQQTDAPENLDLQAVYQSILDAQGDQSEELVLFPEELDGAYISGSYPGLSDLNCKQFVAYVAPVTGYATEIVLSELENAEDAQTAAEIMQNRIDDAAADTGYPENAAVWQKNAQVQVSGNYVGMIVLPDGYTIPENVFSADQA